MTDYTYYCHQIAISLGRVERGIGNRDYELGLARELLEKVPEPSRKIYEGLIKKVEEKLPAKK